MNLTSLTVKNKKQSLFTLFKSLSRFTSFSSYVAYHITCSVYRFVSSSLSSCLSCSIFRKPKTIILISLLSVFTISGCASTKAVEEAPTDGMITSVNVDAAILTISDDTVQFLSQEYAPAKTRFNFITITRSNDKFGFDLKNKLRLKGFEISERTEGSQYNNLKYILDNNAQLIRVLIMIDNRSYSRCYSFNGDPISNWSLIKK